MEQEYEDLPKVQLIPGGTETSATFVINHEDHTIGNSLRYMIMRDKNTMFCGYSMPHPSEPLINMRLQTNANTSARDVFVQGLYNLADLADFIGKEFDKSLIAAGINPDRMDESAEDM